MTEIEARRRDRKEREAAFNRGWKDAAGGIICEQAMATDQDYEGGVDAFRACKWSS